MKIPNGAGIITMVSDFDVEATNVMANIKQADVASASVDLMRVQLADSKKENKKMFIIALLSAIVVYLSLNFTAAVSILIIRDIRN